MADCRKTNMNEQMEVLWSRAVLFSISLIILTCLSCSTPQPLPRKTRHISVSVRKMNDEINHHWKKLLRRLRHARDRRQLPIRENIMDFSNVATHWTNCRQVLLYCKVGLYTVVKNNRVEGVPVTEVTDEEGLFQMESYARSLVRLKHVATNRYVTMTRRGSIELKANQTDDSLFYLFQEENSYDTFASAKYYIEKLYDLFFSLNKNGRPRPGRNTYPGHKSSQFVAYSANRSGLCMR